MIIKKILKSFFWVMLVVILVGCNSQTDSDGETEVSEGGELKVAYSAQPPTLDLHVSTAIATAEIMGQIYESLLTLDAENNIVPMLAESYEQSDDGLTITFNLREDVLFHNGKEMKAEDVVASMNRWKDLPGGRNQFEDSVLEEIDEYTVEMELDKPLSTALTTISQGGTSYAGIMPKEVIEDASPEGVDEFIGTGPYEFVEWSQDQHVHLTKFVDYQPLEEPKDGLGGKKEALIDDIYFEFVLDTSTRMAGIQSGEYDIAQEIPIDDALLLEDNPELETQIIPSVSSLLLIPNKAEGFFADKKAREMLAAVLDPDEIMEAAFTDDRFYRLSHGMMLEPQEVDWSSDKGKEKFNQKDPEKAKKLLEELDYNGETIRIVTDRENIFHYNASVVLEQQLENIGMNVDLQVYDWATILDITDDPGAYELNIMSHSLRPDPTAIYYLDPDDSGSTDSEELLELLDEFRKQPTLEDTEDVFDRLQEWHWDYIPAIKLGERSQVNIVQNTVEGVDYSMGRMLLWNVTNEK